MFVQIFSIVKKFKKMKKIDVSTIILDQSDHFYSISMNSKQFLHEKLLKDDVFEENLVKFGNHVETKPL